MNTSITDSSKNFPEWPSASKMSFLLAKIPNNINLVNKRGLSEKLSFWDRRLQDSLKSSNRFVFNLDDLVKNSDNFQIFYKNKQSADATTWKIILGQDSRFLAQVTQHRSKSANDPNFELLCKKLEHFEKNYINLDKTSDYSLENCKAILLNLDSTWSYWMKNGFSKTVIWPITSKIKIPLISKSQNQENYVLLSQIDWFIENYLEIYFTSSKDCQKFYKKSELADLFVKIITESQAKSSYNQIQGLQNKFSNSDHHLIFIILAQLKRQNKLRTDASLETFSFFPTESCTSENKNNNFITETETVTYQLEQTLSQLKNTITSKESEIKSFKNQALAAKKVNDKPAAINLMKKAKLYEKSLNDLYNQSSNLENLLFQIQNKKDEQKILESLKLGSDVLKELNKESKIEEIESTMNEVEENLDNAEEISKVIAENIGDLNLNQVSKEEGLDLELEKELNDLLKNDDGEMVKNEEADEDVKAFCKEFDDLEEKFAALETDEIETQTLPLEVQNLSEPCLL